MDDTWVARRCAKDYWLSFCQTIQLAADSGNTRSMYAVIKKKTLQLNTSTGEVITDKKLQMGKWIEHYKALLTGDCGQ